MQMSRNTAVCPDWRSLVPVVIVICGSWMASAGATQDPDPSPLFQQSLETSVQKMESEGTRRSPAVAQDSTMHPKPAAPIGTGTEATPGFKCIYELICMSGNPDTLAMWGLEIGIQRAGPDCSEEFDCTTHLETDSGSVCLIWKYVTCGITALPPMPIPVRSTFNRCDCPDLSTMADSPTCQSNTCRVFTCMGSSSCPGGGVITMCHTGPTCGTYTTCGPQATCMFQSTCNEFYPTCKGQTCETRYTCAAFATCPGFLSCTGTPTCGGAPTCRGIISCHGFPTCLSSTTCDGIGNCPLCDCPHQGDINDNDQLDVGDVVSIIHYLFGDALPPQSDTACTHTDRGDIDCDQAHTIIDVVKLIDIVLGGQSQICDPCTGQMVPVSQQAFEKP